jgi:threonine dehydrogenase-like Zn-dependent dehydrogenase
LTKAIICYKLLLLFENETDMTIKTKFTKYDQVGSALPATQWVWPLSGAGLSKLGYQGEMLEQPLLAYGPDELLVRNDAVGLCFSDVKIIQMGMQHPRLSGRDLAAHPLVPGHEVSLTVMAVGENLRDKYQVGQRFAIQPDVWYQGKSTPYGYTLDGAYQQYSVIGPEILNGDAGSYLIPIPAEMTYVGAALTEPWACIEASYRTTYRTTLKDNGRAWFMGTAGSRPGYRLDKIWEPGHQPQQVVITGVPNDLAAYLSDLCRACGVELIASGLDEVQAAGLSFDDIFILDGDADEVDLAATKLAKGGVLAMARPTPMSSPIQMDLGRLHYDHIVYVGTTGANLDTAYQQTPVRTSLKPEGTTWVVGAGGPMGRMHVQRAIESRHGPQHILATEVSSERAKDLWETFGNTAQQRGLDLTVLEAAKTTGLMAEVADRGGIDDVEVMAAIPAVIVESTAYLAAGGVINLFAGLKRGVTAPIDAWLIYGPRQIRLIGHSGSALDDQAEIVNRAAAGHLAPERSMVALAGLKQLPQALQAMIDAVYPGKIVIFPAVLDFPLTALPDLKDVLPQVYGKLIDGRTWTAEAEAAFLETMLTENE